MNMQRFEYITIKYEPEINGYRPNDLPKAMTTQDAMNFMAADGWQFKQMIGNDLLFERQVNIEEGD